MMKATLGRLPMYLSYLKKYDQNTKYITTNIIAKENGLGEVQVRKDLGSFSQAGKPKKGYVLKALIQEIETYLGVNNKTNVVIVGTGKLGLALLNYNGFDIFGINMLAGFDNNEEIIDEKNHIYNTNKLVEYCDKNNVKILVLTVPESEADKMVELINKTNVKAVWNFTNKKLNVKPGILVDNENVALVLANINHKLQLQETEKNSKKECLF